MEFEVKVRVWGSGVEPREMQYVLGAEGARLAADGASGRPAPLELRVEGADIDPADFHLRLFRPSHEE